MEATRSRRHSRSVSLLPNDLITSTQHNAPRYAQQEVLPWTRGAQSPAARIRSGSGCVDLVHVVAAEAAFRQVATPPRVARATQALDGA